MTRILLCLLLLIVSSAALAEPHQGQELYRVHCQTCHGPQGLGDGPTAQALNPRPRNLTKRPYKQGCGPGAIVHTLKNGVEGSGMPTFKALLTEEEMWELAHYVRSLQKGCCSD